LEYELQKLVMMILNQSLESASSVTEPQAAQILTSKLEEIKSDALDPFGAATLKTWADSFPSSSSWLVAFLLKPCSTVRS
jgi:hypothetical protein